MFKEPQMNEINVEDENNLMKPTFYSDYVDGEEDWEDMEDNDSFFD